MCISIIAARFTPVRSFYLSQEFQDTSFGPKAGPDPDRGQGKNERDGTLLQCEKVGVTMMVKSGTTCGANRTRRQESNGAQAARWLGKPGVRKRPPHPRPGGRGTGDVQTSTWLGQSACPV